MLPVTRFTVALAALVSWAVPDPLGSASVIDDRLAVAALDREYQAAVKRNDAVTMDRILHENFALVLGNGTVVTRSELLAVTSAWSALDAAWNARDAKAFSLLFSEDVSFEFVRRGQSLDGRAAVFERFAERFPTFSPELRHRTRVRQVIAIAPELLAMDGRVDILRESADGSGAPAVIRSFAIFAVMSRDGDAAGLSIRALRIYELPGESDDAKPV